MILFFLYGLSVVLFMDNSLHAANPDKKLEILKQFPYRMYDLYAIRKYTITDTIPADKQGNLIVNYKG